MPDLYTEFDKTYEWGDGELQFRYVERMETLVFALTSGPTAPAEGVSPYGNFI